MNICVYCASSNGNRPEFLTLATEIGEQIASGGHSLVYGGSSLGLMGALADSVMENNGDVTGVIPENLFSKEVAHTGITNLITVKNMHERKAVMADLADAFIALPGGFGTMEELFEIITWNQIGIIQKPITLLNADNYYTPLIQMLDRGVEFGYIKPDNRRILQLAETPEECMELCSQPTT